MTTKKENTRLRASDAIKQKFARTLQQRLAEIGMNQSELARRVGVTRDAISTYARERSLPGPEVLKKIAKEIGMQPEDLLPTRYSYEGRSPLSIELKPNGLAHLCVDLELPMKVGFEVMALLQPFAAAILTDEAAATVKQNGKTPPSSRSR